MGDRVDEGGIGDNSELTCTFNIKWAGFTIDEVGSFPRNKFDKESSKNHHHYTKQNSFNPPVQHQMNYKYHHI